MEEHNKYHIGWRNIKTGIAVLVCLIIGRMVGNYEPLYACTAAVICMKDTIENSLKHGIIRMKATIMGGIISICFLAVNQYLPFLAYNEVIVPFAIIITIYCCSILEWKEASALASVVVLVILLMHNGSQDRYAYAINRIIETLMGIVVAIIVNSCVVPPINDITDKKL
ncbi:MAG: FUSC family protein [Filifactoraceae bacterium]